MRQPLISIVVPIHKVEPYLRKCVDSILAQTYTNIEVILVDDGSPDGCPAICDEYAAKDKRIVVIHQRNTGISVARNAGLDAAKGEYIAFVDSDDWIEPDMCEVLYQAIKNSGADIVESSYCIGDSRPVNVGARQHAVFSSRAAVLWMLKGHGEMLYVWGKLFARELVENLRFSPSYTQTEDGPFAIQAIVRSRKIAYLDYPCYHYLVRDDSISHVFSASIAPTLKAIDSIVDVVKSYDGELSTMADKCAMEYDVNRAKEEEEKDWLSKQVYGEIVAHVKTHLNGGSWGCCRFKSKCWLCLLLLGRRPFIGGRKLFRRLTMLKSSWCRRSSNDS